MVEVGKEIVFMLPGPVKMHPRVLEIMASPPINHRGEEFKAIMRELKELGRYLFQTKDEVIFLSGSGTAAMDAAICNLVDKEDKVLNIVNGKFSERLNDISKVYATAKALEFEWGKPVELDAIAAALEEDDYKIVTLCHNETSTGLTNPAEEVGKLVSKTNALFVVDAITAVGGIEVKPDEWHYDVTIVGSQKCLAAPPGTSLLHISKRAEELLKDDGSYYLNLKENIRQIRDKDQTPFTPALPLFLSLREALMMVKEEGLENRIARTARLADASRSAFKALGLKLFPDERYASNTVTAVRYPDNINDKDFRTTLKDELGVIVAGGQSHLKGKIFRIGHMGICDFDDLFATFAAFEKVFEKFGYEFEHGASKRALEAHRG